MQEYSKISGIAVQELKSLEIEFLLVYQKNLFVSEEKFNKYSFHLKQIGKNLVLNNYSNVFDIL